MQARSAFARTPWNSCDDLSVPRTHLVCKLFVDNCCRHCGFFLKQNGSFLPIFCVFLCGSEEAKGRLFPGLRWVANDWTRSAEACQTSVKRAGALLAYCLAPPPSAFSSLPSSSQRWLRAAAFCDSNLLNAIESMSKLCRLFVCFFKIVWCDIFLPILQKYSIFCETDLN